MKPAMMANVSPKWAAVFPSPVGRLYATACDAGVLTLEFEGTAPPPEPEVTVEPGREIFVRLGRALSGYFSGQSFGFDLPLCPQGTEFQRKCWAYLTTIPPGETRTYGQQARALGSPAAVRAVGGSNARNPIVILIPCHRVIGTDGTLTGFGGGLDRKQWLLDHERQCASLFRRNASLFRGE